MSNRTFAFIADGDVFMRIYLNADAAPENAGYIAGLQSNPTIVDVTDLDLQIERGWTYDGQDFHPPVA